MCRNDTYLVEVDLLPVVQAIYCEAGGGAGIRVRIVLFLLSIEVAVLFLIKIHCLIVILSNSEQIRMTNPEFAPSRLSFPRAATSFEKISQE